MNARCPCCRGTGMLEAGAGLSEAGLLRAELARVWGVVRRLEAFTASHMKVSSGAITGLVGELEGARGRIDAQNGHISSLETRLAIHNSWNSRTSDNPEHYEAIKNYREEAQGYGGGQGVKGSDETPGETPGETRRQFRRRAGSKGTTPRKAGGQPKHKGRARNDKPEGTIHVATGLCGFCGTVPDTVRTVRTRMYDLDRREERTTCKMCVVRVGRCPACGAEWWPDNNILIRGTSFGPVLRGHIQTYHDAHVAEEDMQKILSDLENADFAVGTISNCVSAMADHLGAPPLCVPVEEPIVMRDADPLRECRSPVRPPPADDSEFGVQDAALTCHSNLWTSFVAQPVMVRIVERASMDPWAATDETANHIGSEDAYTLVSETLHTTMIRTVWNKDARTLRHTHGWMRNKQAMRDGVTGFEWHKGLLTRCAVHILRKSEDFAMLNGVGSPEYVRHTMMQDLYHDAKHTGREIELRAGGPVRCASRLDTIRRVPGLDEFVRSQIKRLTDRLDMIAESFPPDGLTTTIRNARQRLVQRAEGAGNVTQQQPCRGDGPRLRGPRQAQVPVPEREGGLQPLDHTVVCGNLPKERRLAVPRHPDDGQGRQVGHIQLRNTAAHIRGSGSIGRAGAGPAACQTGGPLWRGPGEPARPHAD